jgi:hypothetical protein
MIIPEIKLPRFETEIRISGVVKAGDRIIYAVAKVSILKIEKEYIAGCWITPLALLIIEPGEQYAVSISGEEMDISEIMLLAPSMKEVVEIARDGRGMKDA